MSEFQAKFWAALKAAKATPRSVAYSLRFYRQLAKRARLDGSKPEEVADWLLDLKAKSQAKLEGEGSG